MANPLKQLAGETAIYGMSTILARLINFCFVPFYTRALSTEQYGVVTEFMAYIGVLQVVLVMGLETGCFRFANKEGIDANKVYSNALTAVTAISMAFLAALIALADPISSWLGYDGYQRVIIFVAGILVSDTITAILFAKLRQEHRSIKFATFKTIKILTELGANLFLFFIYPAKPDFDYPILATFISCIVCFVLFIPTLWRFTFSLDGKLLRQMLVYSIPLMIAQLPGVANDFLDRYLFRYFDTSADAWRSSLGVYQAAVKLSVIMNLFIQMFRFAAEPFFFQRAKNKSSKELYAAVMEVFTAFCGLVFLGVILYVDIIGLILGKDFRSGLGVIPIMLLAYMFLGMLFNVSMWYKLSGRTKMAIWITLAGLVVTASVNIIFMPKYSYWASAWGHLASYVVMFFISAYLGARFNPFPYKWWRIILIFVLMLGTYAASLYLDKYLGLDSNLLVKLAFHTLLLLAYTGLVGLLMIPAWRVARRAGQEEEASAAEKNKIPAVLPLDGVNAQTEDIAINVKNKESNTTDVIKETKKDFPRLVDTPEDEEE